MDPAVLPATTDLPSRPWWLRALDVVIGVTAVLLISAVLFGGLRVRFEDVRVTAESSWKLAAVLALLLLARRAVCRGPSWLAVVVARGRRVRRDRGWRVVLPWLVTTRVTVLYATYLGVVVIGYPEGGPPFRVAADEFGNLLARWDAGWYLGIAESGYNYWGNARAQTNVAFFPAYPLTVRTTAALLGARWGSPGDQADPFAAFTERRHVRLLHAGWLVSVLAFGGGLVYLFRLARDLTESEEAAGAAVALLATYPFGFFYGAVYTEALFLLCATAGFYHFRRRQWGWAAIAGLVAGLSRPNGCLLSVPLGLLALDAWRRDGYRWRTLAAALPVAACAGLGMLAFTWWLHAHTGEWFVWLEAHGAWGRQFSGIHLLFAQRWRDLQSIGLAGYTAVHAIEILNMAATFLVLGVSWPIARRYGLAWAAFLLVTVLPPLFMGGFLSMGRVTSTLFPVFIYLGARLQRRALPQVLLVSFALQVALAVMHFTWRQVY
ncbi:MAG: mannosyltransferase family protein [Luteitalea sp.]